jgi:hypothetical protein
MADLLPKNDHRKDLSSPPGLCFSGPVVEFQKKLATIQDPESLIDIAEQLLRVR